MGSPLQRFRSSFSSFATHRFSPPSPATYPKMDPQQPNSAPMSAATTIVPSQPTSRAHSLHGDDALEKKPVAAFHPEPEEIHVAAPPSKDRAPVFVVVLCLFQSLAGLLFGWMSGSISGLVSCADCTSCSLPSVVSCQWPGASKLVRRERIRS